MIWIASFPKSGNTWMRALLSNVYAESPEPWDINDLSFTFDGSASRAVFEEETLADSSLLTSREINALMPFVRDALAAAAADTERFVKTHDVYDELPDGTPMLGSAARAAIYVVRDPRDVVISWTHFFDCSIDDAIAALHKPQKQMGAANALRIAQRLRGWSAHVASWLDQARLPTRLVRYEDLLAEPARTFRGVLDDLGIAATDEAVSRAVRNADFAELRRQEQERGFCERPPQAKMFFREGRAGQWHAQLTDAQVTAIEQTHGATMARLGYLQTTPTRGS